MKMWSHLKFTKSDWVEKKITQIPVKKCKDQNIFALKYKYLEKYELFLERLFFKLQII